MKNSTLLHSLIEAGTIGLLFSFTSCHNYYMASLPEYNDLREEVNIIDSLKKEGKYFILRNGPNAYHITDISLNEDKKTVDTKLENLPSVHRMYINKDRKGKMIYKKLNPTDLKVLQEVHLYINPDSKVTFGSYDFPIDSILKIEIIVKNQSKTAGSYFLAVGPVIAAGIAALIIFHKSPAPPPPPTTISGSCPYISTYTGKGFEFQGEIYSGAIYPQLARDDYMPVQMKPTADGRLLIRIENEMEHEEQHTDIADLSVVTHSLYTKILPDEKGKLYSITDPQTPIDAYSPHKKNILPLLQKAADGEMLYFDDTLSADAGNYVITQFKNPGNVSTAKLVLSVKSTVWLEYLYDQLAKKIGNYYPKFIKSQYKKPSSKLIQWAKDQHLPLKVSIKTKSGWKDVANLNSTGLLSTREMVVPLNFTNLPKGNIQIKLSSGFMFWDIDYTAIDYTVDSNFEVENLSPSSAIDETGKNVLLPLIKKDGNYLQQPLPGNVTTVEYKCKPQPVNTSRSYILHTNGYYTHIWNYKGSPDFSFLKHLKRANAFPQFSMMLYKKLVNAGMQSLVKQ